MAQDAFAISSAREVAKSGIEDYFAGRYAAANDKLTRAFEVVRVPTLALFNARSLAKLGKLVSASELYLLAMRLPDGEGDAETQQQARRDAKVERNELLLRIPRLQVSITGAPFNSVAVYANDARVAASLLASGWLVDPGTVKVIGLWGQRRVEATERFAERESKTITLHFEPQPATPANAAQQTDASPTVTSAFEHDTSSSRSGTRTAAWLSFGIGGAGLLAGVGTGIAAMADKRRLDRDGACNENHQCYGSADTERYNFLRNFATTGFIVAGVGAVVGTVLYFSSPRRANSAATVTARHPAIGTELHLATGTERNPASATLQRPTTAHVVEVMPWVGVSQIGILGVF
jgi:hypothetical protein